MPSDPKSKCPDTSATGTLFVVATPIGNLADFTFRAIETLKSVSLILCEDTRTSRTLLSHYGISTPCRSYHDHSTSQDEATLIAKLAEGQSLALISDAGTPLISDPGFGLVRAARHHGIRVVPIPGASSIMAALCSAGLPTDAFYVAGFLPAKAKARSEAIGALASLPATLVFLESPNRLLATLSDLQTLLGDRPAAIAREITKLHEEILLLPLSELAATFASRERIRGEIVLMVQGAGERPAPDDRTITLLLTQALQTHRVKEAAALVAEATGLSKSELYQRALALKEER